MVEPPPPLDQTGVVVAADEGLVVDEPAEEPGIGLDAADDRLVERPAQPIDGRRAVLGVDHQLGEQRVVFGAEVGVGLDPGVDPDAGAGRHRQAVIRPAVGRKPSYGFSA